MREDPTLSAIIVSFRTPELTERAVQSALAEPLVGEVVVVDNGSGDDSVARLRRIADPRLLVIASTTNSGFGAAANHAARVATGAHLLFLNSDARLRSGALQSMLQELERSGGRGIVGPRLIGHGGAVQRSAGLVPRPLDLLIRGLGIHRLARPASRLPGLRVLLGRSPIQKEYNLAVTADAPVEVSMVSGACFAIGTEAFWQLGGFDERYFMYFEDADLCRRATAAGWSVRYVPDASIDHIGGASSSAIYQLGPLHGPSMVIYLRRWYGLPGAIFGLTVLALRALVMTVARRASRHEARAALGEGLRAYRRGRSRLPSPTKVPAP